MLKNFLLAVAALLFACSISDAQVYVSKNVIKLIKDGNTHVVVDDNDFPRSVEFFRVFKKYWTVTKGVEFMKTSELDSGLVAGDTYFTLEKSIVTSNYGGQVYFYLSLWIPSKKSLKPKHKFEITEQQHLGGITLSADVELSRSGKFEIDFSGSGKIYNWNPGLLKNYLQQLVPAINSGKEITSLFYDFTDKQHLAALKNETLYYTRDALHIMGTFVTKDHLVDTAEVFQDYKYKHQMISNQELEDKILADVEPVYYLLFIRNSSIKWVTVINSRTGEKIYARYKSLLAFTLKRADLKTLYKEIRNN